MDISNTTVLMIDANTKDREYFGHRLRISSPDYLILEANDGRSGLRICRSHRVDCVVLELGLPDMSGLQFLIQLIPRPRYPEQALVVLSHMYIDPIPELAKAYGAQAFLLKDYASGDELANAVRKAIAAVGLTRKEPRRSDF